jgi:hypothetical protein
MKGPRDFEQNKTGCREGSAWYLVSEMEGVIGDKEN